MIKQHFLCLCFLLSTIMLHAQYRRSVEFMYSPDYSYQHTLNEDADPRCGVGLMGEGAKMKRTQHVGLAITSRINKRLSTKIGVQFVIMGYRYPPTLVSIDSSLVTKPSDSYTFETESYFITRYWSVPLLLRYEKQLSNRWFWSAEGGMAIQYRQSSKMMFRAGNETSITINPCTDDKMSYAVLLNTGLSYALSRKWALFVQPAFRYNINTLYLRSRTSAHLFAIGLETGVKRCW